jgi:hypothetical protein
MKIAFFTEMNFTGKIPRTHENMRTEFAWMVALEADHYHFSMVPFQKYDLGIVIIPKKNPQFDINLLKQYCNKLAVMQEGPHWYFQDYPLDQQVWYFNTLTSADIIFTHNKVDKLYYQGLTNHPDVRVMPSLMIEEAIGELTQIERQNIMIGGNFVSWYGGFDSFIVASELELPIYAPSMGRKQEGEEQLGLHHLPYLNWKQWIHELNKYKYGVHLMRTHAAGTFALNCSYLGIPCIGYYGLDTQEILHPLTTIDIGDLKNAKKILNKLHSDAEFYLECSNITKNLYEQNYKESIYKQNFF